MNKGKNIVQAFQFIQNFYREVAQLATKLDDLMEQKGWRSARGNTATSLVSKDLLKPDKWLPDGIFRLYVNKKIADVRKGVVICFVTEELKEPILIISTMKYNKNKKATDWDIWNLWFDNDKRVLNKDYIEYNPEDKDQYIYKGVIKKASMYAISLVKITNEEEIKSKVFKKLMEQK
jgi:hypothetical protein